MRLPVSEVLGGELTILNFWVEVFKLSDTLNLLGKFLPIKNFADEIESLLEILVESVKDDLVKIFKSELTLNNSACSLSGNLVELCHLLFKDSLLVFLERLALILASLKLVLKTVNLLVLYLYLALCLEQLVHGLLRAIKVLLLFLKALELLLLLLEQSGLLLSDVGKPFAFQEQLFEIS
jgi:hypothetical protein